MSTRHSKAAEAYLNNDAVVNRHDQTFFGVRQKRDRMAQGLPEWERLREAASQIKKHTATHLADYLELFEKNARKNGVHVHWAQDAEDCSRHPEGAQRDESGEEQEYAHRRVSLK